MHQLIQFLLVIPRLMGRLHPLRFLCAKKWGIIWSMPLIFLGIVGFVIFALRDKRERWPYLMGLILSSFFTLGMDEGSDYGLRYFLTNLPLCLLGLALVVDKLFEWKKWWLAVLLVFFASLWQYLSVIQYRITLWWDNPRYTFDVLPVLFKTIKEGNLGVIFLRPLSWFSMVFRWGFKIQSLTDAFFLIGIPVLFIFFLFIPLIVWYFGLHRKIVVHFLCRKTLVCAFTVLGFFVVTDAVLLLENPPKTDKEMALNYRIAGHRYLEKRDYARSYGYLKVSQNLNSDDREVTRLLGYALFYLDSLSQSHEAFQEVIASGQENYGDYVYLAATRLRLGASRESVMPLLMKALAMTGDDPEAKEIVLEQIKKWGFNITTAGP